MDDNSKCGNCFYWMPYDGRRDGQCHRYSPKTILIVKNEEHQFLTDWPETIEDDFCGEHKSGTPRAGLRSKDGPAR